ncbi:MAG TPA: hypothetical protein PK491_13535, partial [Candidatus Hydrogenedentes bacterium]|nr:hypothetical protein [Candidatus Hydrogenedentota bacterium]
MNIAKSVLPVFCALVVSALFSACSTEAIWVSRDQIDFDRDESPMYFHVANNNAEMGTFTVNITGNK